MLALLLLAVALGLDNLAAAIGIGTGGIGTGRVRGAARVRIAVVFGLFEAGMPVLGLRPASCRGSCPLRNLSSERLLA